MIVGSRDLKTLRRNLNDLDGYCISLLPKYIRHNQKIINNQKYYVALEVRKMKDLDYDTRKKLCENLLKGVYVTGNVSEIIEVRDLLDFIDYNKLCYNLFKLEE